MKDYENPMLRPMTDQEEWEQLSEDDIKELPKCIECGDEFDISKMEADHINPWHAGGKTNEDNCQMLCKEDNRKKSGK